MQTTNAGVITATVPTNASAQTIPAWAYDSLIDDNFAEQFTVGTLDASGGSHTLVAYCRLTGQTVLTARLRR